MYYFCRGKGEYLEYHFSVKIPQKVFTNQDATVRRYKYHVESPATEEGVLKSWELIPIPKQSSGVIDRSLKLYNDETTCGCKLMILTSLCTVQPLYYGHFGTQNFWPLFAVI